MPLTSLRVLLAEDNPTNQLVAMQMLESLGAEAVLAEDGEQALDLALSQRFDVGLIDIEMPRLSGIEVIRRLREATGDASDMTLIALTAYVMREHRIAIDEAGADGVIAKPILSIEQFGREILQMMRRRSGPRMPAPAVVPDESAGPPGHIDRITYDALMASIGTKAGDELLSRVESDIVAVRTDIAAESNAKNAEVMRSASHILISVAGAIGATTLQTLAKWLNSAAHSGDLDRMVAARDQTLPEIDAVLDFVRGKQQG